MIICKLCNREFKTNAGGDLTKHLINDHGIMLKDYIILTEYSGNAPVCKCGFCNEDPEFYRGKFKAFAKGHSSAEWYHSNYIKVYGCPVCEECGKEVQFRNGRKVFPRFCSTVCSGMHNKETIIQKMRPKIINKYKDPVYKERFLNAIHEKFKDPVYYRNHVARTIQWNRSEISRHQKSIYLTERWKDIEFRKHMCESIKERTNTPHEKRCRSERTKDKWRDPYTRKLYINALLNISKKFSKTHLRIAEQLKLRDLGFVGEQKIGRYSVDELHAEKGIIIEINGDYVHANPKYYASDDIIRLPGSSYTAEEKWDSDERRRESLESMGYRVLVIWETDSIDAFKERLVALLS